MAYVTRDVQEGSESSLEAPVLAGAHPWAGCRPRRIRVGLLGCGRIGQAVVATARTERERLTAAGIELTVIRALVRDLRKPRSVSVPLVGAAASFAVEDLDVLVEVLGGLEPARTLVGRALRAGVPVVTANKTLIAHAGAELDDLACRHDTVLVYDAAVLAGVPFLGSLARRPLLSGAHRITGIVNGTSHAIATALGDGVPFRTALAEATRLGYAEPDSRADISGRDAAEKLAILLRLAGIAGVDVQELTTVGIDRLSLADFEAAHALGGTVKPIACAELSSGGAGAYVGPAFVPERHPLAAVTGVTNVLQIRGAAGHAVVGVPDVIFQGPGAGPAVTAATIIDDIVEAIDARPPRPIAVRRGCDLRQPPVSSWFVRIEAACSGDAAENLSDFGLSVSRSARGKTWIAALTAPATWGDIGHAIAAAQRRSIDAVAYPACECC